MINKEQKKQIEEFEIEFSDLSHFLKFTIVTWWIGIILGIIYYIVEIIIIIKGGLIE